MGAPVPDALARALAAFDGPVADLLSTGRVSVVPLGHPGLARIPARPCAAPLRDGLPSRLLVHADGVTLALARLRDLGAGLVRAAQALAPAAAQAEALAAVAAEGASLVLAARDRVRAGTALLSEHRDLRWCASPAAWASDDAAPHLERFSTFLELYPTPETLALGAWEGLDGREAVCGAVYAHYIARHGRLDAGCDAAREAVAYRHARCPHLLGDLFAEAALAAGHDPGARP